MQKIEIRILPEADEFLYSLPMILVEEGYKSSYSSAEKIVDEILDFISQLPIVPHYTLPPSVEYHFSCYGEDLYYSFFKRKKSPKTTWYIFLVKSGKKILVKHITNNWIEGQYIR